MVFDEFRAIEGKVDRPPFWRICQLAGENESHRIFDNVSTPVIESADMLINNSFNEAVKSFEALDPQKEQEWYKFRNSRINHMVNSFSSFRTDTLRCGGAGSAPNALRDTKGPSWRLLVDFSHPGEALGIYPGGQSGNPGSFYYDNWVSPYENGDYLNLKLRSPNKEEILYTITIK